MYVYVNLYDCIVFHNKKNASWRQIPQYLLQIQSNEIYNSNKHKDKFYYLNYIHDNTNFKRNYQYKISKISIQLETPGILTSFFSVKKMQGHMDMESAHFSVIVSRHVEVSSRRQPKLIVSCPFDMDPTATAHRQTSNLTILGD
jgi:hypothetical protein